MNKNLELILAYFLCMICSGFVFIKLIIFLIQNGLKSLGAEPRKNPPPILSDEKWGTHHIIELKKQGVKLHYVQKGDQGKPLLLFLHGFPECWLSWRHQIQEFAKNYWVIAVDMRGYGESDKPKGKKNYEMEILVEDIREFLIELGKPKCALVAHDWGGVIAWELMDRYPELFDVHISINGPPSSVMRPLLLSNFRQLRMSWYVFFFLCPILPEVMLKLNNLEFYTKALREGPKDLTKEFPDDVMEGYYYYFSAKGAFTPPVNYYRSAINYFSTPSKEKIKVPTLILWGMDDYCLCPLVPKRSQELCENVELQEFKSAGHFVHEEAPKQVNEAITNYLLKQKL